MSADIAAWRNELQLNGERSRRHTRTITENCVNKNFLIVPVNAALRPEKRGALVLGKIVFALAVLKRLVDNHRLTKRHKCHVGALRRNGDEREHLALINALRLAPAIRISDAFHNFDSGRRINCYFRISDRFSCCKRSHPNT